MRKSGKSSLACSSLIVGWTITSSPGIQLIGVVTLYLSPVIKLSRALNTSAELRPVEAGYERMRRMVFLGSMTKTERMVKAMPFSSTLVVSW